MKHVGATLREIREQRKLTLMDVEEQSRVFAQQRGDDSYGISSSWLDRLEKDQEELTASALVVLADIYGLRPPQLLRSIYPDLAGSHPPPDETILLSPEPGQLPGVYRQGIIGKQDHSLTPLLAAGSVVQIDTRLREVARVKPWAHELQRPIYFVKTANAYFCGWCEMDSSGDWLTLVPHPLSPASSRRWKYPEEVTIVGRVIAASTRFIPATE